MYFTRQTWNIEGKDLEPDFILHLAAIGEALQQPCLSLLEGKEGDHERSYLGFGEGWVLRDQVWDEGNEPDPLIQLRKFRKDFIDCLKEVNLHSELSPNLEVESERCGTSEDCELECGLIGYLDYEWGLYWQKPSAAKTRPGYFFRLCPVNIVLLPRQRKLVLEVFAPEKERIAFLQANWSREITNILEGVVNAHAVFPLQDTRVSESQDKKSQTSWQANMTKVNFISKVEQIQEWIRAGDVFQTVLSQRFTRQGTLDPWILYQKLRVLNPSPYLFHVQADRETLVGSSPELLVSTQGRQLVTRPIAGTRPRGKHPTEDIALENELRSDPKENAEHAMLVDLGRNDLGRVSRYGTVSVKQYAEVERFSHVMHLVSTVEGELALTRDGLSALQAVFPAGTLSGAPKVRAMEIIQELEGEQRGAYGGALGIVRFNGDLDFCITIRTIRLTAHEISVQAGAGIVFDSIAEREYQETLDKAKALMKGVDACVNGD